MIRVMFENFLLFLLPTVIYLAVRYVQRARSLDEAVAKGGQTVRDDINNAPFLWLFLAGAVLVLATLIAFGSSSESGKPGQTYYPPTIKDGQKIPGHFK